MGNCCTNTPQPISDTISYQNFTVISIKEKDIKQRVIRTDNITVSVTYPTYQNHEKIQIDKLTFEFSSCVLPGLDPRGLIKKECQDNLFYINTDKAILVGLFDGHGKEGRIVANFCCNFMKDYFSEKFLSFEENPKTAIETIIIECDAALRDKKSKIDASLSGTTALVMYIDVEGFHVASVGDSRAVLATLPDSNEPTDPHKLENDLSVPKTRYTRKIEPIRQLKPVPLSIDQKPNHEAELKRIEEYGGKVMQLTDDYGNKIGPYRVWQKNGGLPGLAMSRSIGDGFAKKLGVIANPIYHFFPHIKFRDQFIIISSDGVWDVIENIEIIDFIERFRKKCIKGIGPKNYPHGIHNSSISQLVAEEARFRWYGVCEEEDVMIDDISVVVIEMGNLEPAPLQLPPSSIKRKTISLNVAADVKAEEEIKSGAIRGDVMRGSFIPAESEKGKKRFDAKRGSYISKEISDDEEVDEKLDGIPYSSTEIDE